MNFNVSRGMKTVKSVITANSPVLLVGATITGIVATGVMSAKAGYKARGIIDAERERRVDEVTERIFSTPLDRESAVKAAREIPAKDMVSLTWLCYAAPALTAVSAIASCMGLHMIHSKRHAALAGLYAITAGKLDDYREEAEALLGVKKTQDLNDTMAQKNIDKHPINNQVVLTEGGSELCFDDWTGRYFKSNLNLIESALNEVNAILIDEGEVDLNTLYDRLGLEPIPSGGDLGWSRTKTKKITLKPGTVKTPEGRPALVVSFRTEPKPLMGA